MGKINTKDLPGSHNQLSYFCDSSTDTIQFWLLVFYRINGEVETRFFVTKKKGGKKTQLATRFRIRKEEQCEL